MPYINPHKETYKNLLEILEGCELQKIKLVAHKDRTEYKLRYLPLPKRFRELTAFHGALLAGNGKNRYGGMDYNVRVSQINDWVEFSGVIFTKNLIKGA